MASAVGCHLLIPDGANYCSISLYSYIPATTSSHSYAGNNVVVNELCPHVPMPREICGPGNAQSVTEAAALRSLNYQNDDPWRANETAKRFTEEYLNKKTWTQQA